MTTEPLNRFPTVIDNSMRSVFVQCPQKFYRQYIQGWRPAVPSVHLHAGGSFARGLEVTRKAFYGTGMSADDSVAEGIRALYEAYGEFEYGDDSPKSVQRMAGALVSYFDTYPLATDFIQPAKMADGRLAVEFSGIIELPIKHPETGDPLMYGGRFDMLAIKDGVLFVEDDKTTSQLGPSWSKRWDLNAQFTGYCHLAQAYGFPVAGAIIRGVSILKGGYGHAQVITYRPNWQIDRWMQQLLHDIERMISCWHRQQWDYDLADACSAYGGCSFLRICQTNDPDRWLQSEFQMEDYRPFEKGPAE